MAFSNAMGGKIDIGIENDGTMPPAEQRVPEDLPTAVVNKISGITHGVIISTEIVTAENGGEYIRLSMTASQLIGQLHLKDVDALRSWLRPVVDKVFVVSNNGAL